MRIGPALVLLTVAAASPVSADDAAVARSLAATCASCHGTDGRAVGQGMPPLAGRSREFIASRMREYREATRESTVMHQLARGYTQAQVDLMAAYFAAQKAR